MNCQWPRCSKPTMPGKTYCRNHIHGSETGHSYKYRKQVYHEGLYGYSQSDSGGNSQILGKNRQKGSEHRR